jgi:hypothetical protein
MKLGQANAAKAAIALPDLPTPRVLASGQNFLVTPSIAAIEPPFKRASLCA